MKKFRYNFHKDIKMQKIVAKDTLRPVLEYIFFDGDNMVATDGSILVVNKIKECSTFSDEHISFLNGKYLHYKDYEFILNFDIVTISDEGFEIKDKNRNIIVKFDKNCGIFPKYDSVFPYETELTENIGINPLSLYRLSEALPFKNTFHMYFKGNKHAITIKSTDFFSKGLIMPKLID